MKPKLVLYLLLVTTIVVTGCTPEAAVMTSTPTASRTMFPSASPVPPTSTPTPTAIPTSTPPPTLPPDQAKAAIQTLLREPVDCDAPCFWGVIPGQTTLEEAKHIFARLRLHLSRTNTRDNKEFYTVVYRLDNGIEITPILTVQENVVRNLYAGIVPEPQQPGVPRSWLAYSPETLIARYGTPSRIDFFLGRREPPRYSMQMYFDEVNLIVQYGSYDITFVPEGIRVCPLADQYDSIGVWLGKNPEHPPGAAVPLEEATNLTTEEFAELLVGNPKEACFNLKSEAFP